MADTRTAAWHTMQARMAKPPQPDVPPTRAERERLLRAVQDYARAERLVPPMSLDELRAHAATVLEREGMDAEFKRFAMVLVSNAAWSDTLAGIPYNRRLLLMPQCLRDAERCEGKIDEFGLVCAHCGRCPIHDLQTEAERLGYVVLVAEGTAVVTSLIATGQIEAIVGVSCLSVLERVFPFMEAGAVPGVAIPLLYDGCVDTCVELDWLWDAVQLTSDDRTRRLDIDALRADVQGWFAPAALDALLGPTTSHTERIAREWLARAGKRWRPFLGVCAFQAFQPDPTSEPPDDVRRLAVAIECFHKASLVHDDIEDNDAFRYGQPTVHEAHGIPVALNVGDFLLGEGYRLVAEAAGRQSAQRAAEMLRVAAEGHRSLCVGQGEELWWMREPQPLTPEQVLDIFRQKTAPAFEVALALGAVHAGADGDVARALAAFSAALGTAYQIRDELADFSTEAAKADGAMSPSLLLALGCERAEGDLKELLEAAWRTPWRTSATRPELERVVDHLGATDAARDLLETHKQEAIRALRSLDNATLKGLLRRVIGRIFNELDPECQHHDPA